MPRPRILFVAAHRYGRSPSQRFRYEQYVSWLEANGFDCDFATLLDARDDRIFYSPGKVFSKARIFAQCWLQRRRDTRRAKDFDIVFIQREAFMTGSTRFERAFLRSGAKLVYDFDDAIWLMDVSDGNRFFRWLKNPAKTSELIRMSHLVIAGNNYLGDYAKQYNTNVMVIPTVVETAEYTNTPRRATKQITIGWSGSHTTIKHFEYALPFLRILKKKYGDRIVVRVMGDEEYVNEEFGIRGIAWSREREAEELSRFDIGIMPLPDDEWAKGKCGLKGLQYMAQAIPTVMSPVGVNAEIIRDGENGFLAGTPEEWAEKISLLIESPELRDRIGKAARQSVIENYSVLSQRDKYLALFRNLLNQ